MKIQLRALKWCLKSFDRMTYVASIVCCAVLTIDITMQVFFRYVLNNSLQWSEELGVYLMIWMVFLGSSVLMKNLEHVSINVLIKRLPYGMMVFLTFFMRILILLFLGIVIFYGFKVFGSGFTGSSPSIGFSTKWVKLAIPVGGILMGIDTIQLIVKEVGHFAKKNRDYFTTLYERL